MKPEQGSTVLEAVAALAVAALFVTSAAQNALRAGRTLSAVSMQARMLGAARNALEASYGAPCAAGPACPPGLNCRLLHRSTGPIIEISAEVQDETDTEAGLTLALLASPREPCA